MDKSDTIYICPVCFQTCDSEIECHAHRMIACKPGPLDDPRRKPVVNGYGQYASRAPRWFIEAAGWPSYPYTPLHKA